MAERARRILPTEVGGGQRRPGERGMAFQTARVALVAGRLMLGAATEQGVDVNGVAGFAAFFFVVRDGIGDYGGRSGRYGARCGRGGSRRRRRCRQRCGRRENGSRRGRSLGGGRRSRRDDRGQAWGPTGAGRSCQRYNGQPAQTVGSCHGPTREGSHADSPLLLLREPVCSVGSGPASADYFISVAPAGRLPVRSLIESCSNATDRLKLWTAWALPSLPGPAAPHITP